MNRCHKAFFSFFILFLLPVCALTGDLLDKNISVPLVQEQKWVKGIHSENRETFAALCRQYSETKDKRYADKAREMLLNYAEMYPSAVKKFTNSFTTGALFEQILNEAVWFVHLIEGYDAVKDVFSADENVFIENNLLRPAVKVIKRGDYFGLSNHKWWHNAAIGMIGFFLNDEKLVRYAVDGKFGFKKHIAEAINDDGFLWEGAIAYHYYALDAYLHLAQYAYKHNVDLYNVKVPDGTAEDGFNGEKSLKMMFDVPLYYAFPDMELPNIKDSGGKSFSSELRDYSSFYETYFKDDAHKNLYKAAIDIKNKNTQKALLYKDGTFALNGKHVKGCSVFPTTGYVILRSRTNDINATSVNISYGPYGGGHGHPDKLSIVVYANGETILPDFGKYDYGDPMHVSWLKQTVSHNTVVVDETSQMPMEKEGASLWAFPKDNDAGALERFDAYDDVKVVRIKNDRVYPGVALERTIILKDNELIDVYEVKSGAPHRYDYVLHINGTLQNKSVLLNPVAKTLGKKSGYQHVKNIKETVMNGALESVYKTEAGHYVKVLNVLDEETKMISGDTPSNPKEKMLPVQIARREKSKTTYVSLIEPYKSESEIVSVKKINVKTDNILALEIQKKNIVERLVLTDGEKTEIPQWKILTDAKCLIAETDKAGNTAFTAHDVSFLKVRNEKLYDGKKKSETVERTLWNKKTSSNHFISMIADNVMRTENPEAMLWSWGEGVLMTGMMRAYEVTGDQEYLHYVKRWLDSYQKQKPFIWHNDTCLPGLVSLMVYEKTKESKYLEMTREIEHFILKTAKRTKERALFHFGRQIWVDGLFMTAPFLSKLSRAKEDARYVVEAAGQIILFLKYTKDETKNLSYHMYDANMKTHSPHFWGRGNGWVVMAMVEVLENLPDADARQKEIIKNLQEYVSAICALQAQSGLWHTVLDRKDSELETSASAMFAYSLTKAVKHKWIDRKYLKYAEKTFAALRKNVTVDGKVSGVSGPTSPGDFENYQKVETGSYPWGTGAFLMAFSEKMTMDGKK